MAILNLILHLEPPCATPTHIFHYLIPTTLVLQIIVRYPAPVTFDNGMALMYKSD